jgi:hypothetical protein
MKALGHLREAECRQAPDKRIQKKGRVYGAPGQSISDRKQ